MTISGKTRVCGVIGDPIEHSLSPIMHNAAFQALDLDYVYLAFKVKPACVTERSKWHASTKHPRLKRNHASQKNGNGKFGPHRLISPNHRFS